MDIIIISEFCDDFSKTDNDRFAYLANLLTKNNYVELITSTFQHTVKRHRSQPVDIQPFKITFIYEPGYKRNICLKRFFSHYIWGKGVLDYIASRKKPDVIYCAIPSLSGPNRIARYCKKNGIRFIIDIQDLWPEAFQMVLNVPVISKIIFSPFKALADGIYKRADAICAVSDSYCERAKTVNKSVSEATAVFLGTELETFDNNVKKNPVLDKKFGEIWLAYCATFGCDDDLTCVIDVLHFLNNPKLRLIVMGDELKLDELQCYAKQKNVNVEFVGRLQYNAMCSLLSACDIAVNSITHLAVQLAINKPSDYSIFEYSAANAQKDNERKKLNETYYIDFDSRSNKADDFVKTLKKFVDNPCLMQEMNKDAYQWLGERFDEKGLYKLLKDQILTCRGGYCGLVKMPNDIWLGYSGTLGASYDLPLVFEALRKVDNPNLRFIVMGDGPLMNEFREKALGLNVSFTGRLDYGRMCGVASCDMVVNPIVGLSVASIINKHADYAASGKPVLNTQKSIEYRNLIEQYNMGFNCDGADELSDCIKELVDNSLLRKTYGINARKCANEKFDRAVSYSRIMKTIQIN